MIQSRSSSVKIRDIRGSNFHPPSSFAPIHAHSRSFAFIRVHSWHALKGNEPKELAEGRSFDLKLTKLAVLLGKVLRAELGLTGTAADCIARFKDSLRPEPEKTSTA